MIEEIKQESPEVRVGRIKAYIHHLEGNYLTPVGVAQDTIYADLKWAVSEIERLQAELADASNDAAESLRVARDYDQAIHVASQYEADNAQLRAALERAQYKLISRPGEAGLSIVSCISCGQPRFAGCTDDCDIASALKGHNE